MNAPLSIVRSIAPLALTLVLGLSCGAATSAAPGGAALLELGLDTASGGALDPARVEGRVVLYEFWATWCTPCHVQVEILKELYPEARSRGVEFVAVATGEPEDDRSLRGVREPDPRGGAPARERGRAAGGDAHGRLPLR